MSNSKQSIAAAAIEDGSHARTGAQELSVIEDLMAAGQMLPSQLPSRSDWSAEKKLAAAVLASALVCVRDHAHQAAYRRKVAEDLEWFASDDATWPFSFVRLCDLFDLEPQWVRQVVRRWLKQPLSKAEKPVTPYRHAA